MTLQERHEAKQAELNTLTEKYAALRADGVQMEQQMIRIDAELKLLEDLIAAQTEG